jgi:hypothetical protein
VANISTTSAVWVLPPDPVRRDQLQEPAVGVDQRQAEFMAIHHSPGRALLIGIRRDPRRVAVNDVLDAGLRVGGQQALDRDQADEPPRLENDDPSAHRNSRPASCSLTSPTRWSRRGTVSRAATVVSRGRFTGGL